MIRFVLLFFFADSAISLSKDEPIVVTSLGSILGSVKTTRKGFDFYAFRGIPYAEPPIGELRFKVSSLIRTS